MSKKPWAEGVRSARADAMLKQLREVAAAERIMTNERVLAALEKHGALSIEQLVWKTELAKSVVQNAIDRLRRDGEVKRLDERRRVGQRGVPAHLYELGVEDLDKPKPAKFVAHRHPQDVALYGEYQREIA